MVCMRRDICPLGVCYGSVWQQWEWNKLVSRAQVFIWASFSFVGFMWLPLIAKSCKDLLREVLLCRALCNLAKPWALLIVCVLVVGGGWAARDRLICAGAQWSLL